MRTDHKKYKRNEHEYPFLFREENESLAGLRPKSWFHRKFLPLKLLKDTALGIWAESYCLTLIQSQQ